MSWFPRSSVRVLLLAALLGGLAGAGACASIEYKKVPSPTQYGDYWTIEDQRRADAMEGPRFYLPRPYVSLKQPVPVATRTAFVSFEYRSTIRETLPDGTLIDRNQPHFALVLPKGSPEWIERILPSRLSISTAKEFFQDAKTRAAAEQQSGALADSSDGGGGGDAAAPTKPPTSVSGSVGFINDVDPQTKLGYWLDVVYLPDMDEQYVIQRNYGLGAGDLEIKLRNGWAAETFGESVDNSNLIPYVLDQVERASKTASHIAKGWGDMKSVEEMQDIGTETVEGTGADTSTDGTDDTTGTEGEGAEQQSGGIGGGEDDISNLLGQLVLLKVVEVKIAQPGLYPIMKPREIKDWFKLMYNQRTNCTQCDPGCVIRGYDQHVDPDKALRQLLMNRGLPWINPDRVFIPAPPFTMVGFNVVTDAYIGPVRKDQLGFSTQTAVRSVPGAETGETGGGGNGGSGGQQVPDLAQWAQGLMRLMESTIVDGVFASTDDAPVTASTNAADGVDFIFALTSEADVPENVKTEVVRWFREDLFTFTGPVTVAVAQSGATLSVEVGMAADDLRRAENQANK